MIVRTITAIACICTFSAAASSSSQLSAQGFSGFINTPSAFSSAEGRLQLQYNDLVNDRSGLRFSTADNYLFSIGLASRWELGGRLINQGSPGFGSNTNTFDPSDLQPQDRDLSVQTKLVLFRSERWPQLAIGAQDLSGNERFRSEYAVIGQQYGPVQFAVGIGRGRMDGVFYGASIDAGRHVQFVIDDDTRQRSAAIRLNSGSWLGNAQLSAYWRFYSDVKRNESAFGLGVEFPLGGAVYPPNSTAYAGPDQQEQKTTQGLRDPAAQPLLPKPVASAARSPQTESVRPRAMQNCPGRLTRALTDAQLERVGVRLEPTRLVLEYDGHAYPRSDVDALGIAIGLVVEHCAQSSAADLQEVLVQAKHNGQSKFWLSARLSELVEYFDGGAAAEQPIARSGLGRYPADGRVGNSARRKTWLEVTVDPVINYTIGTEFGVFDYSAGLETNVFLPLWSGAELSARRRDRLARSDDFEFGRRFFLSNIENGWDSRLFQQVLAPFPGVVINGWYGRTDFVNPNAETYGGEMAWQPFQSGHLQLYSKFLRYGSGKQLFDNDPVQERETWTGTARLFSAGKGVALDLTWGRYLFGDEGLRVIFRRYFGDTHIGLIYKATKDFNTEAVGFSFSFPLTPRRSPRIGPVRFAGTPNYTTFIQTLINQQTNFLRPDLVIEVLPGNNLQTDYFDRGRLSPQYLESSWYRMRVVYQEYRAIVGPNRAQ